MKSIAYAGIKLAFLLAIPVLHLQCKDEPTGPEMNCALLDAYSLEYHFVTAGKVFDIRTNPPAEIKNDIIEYGLYYQWALHHDDSPVPAPYHNYFIDSIRFVSPDEARVHIFESNQSNIYTYTRNDCGIDLHSAENDLHLEFTQGGDEVTEKRFAIYDHRSKYAEVQSMMVRLDTFSFLEYRLGPFSTYEEIIKQFALDNTGLYDTVAIELIVNKTRE